MGWLPVVNCVVHCTTPMRTPHPTIFETIRYALEAHEQQVDRAGAPYIAHLLTVMRGVPEPDWHVAVLHDLLEDTSMTAGWLCARGYDEAEIASIQLLTRSTKPAEVPYEDYIERIATSGNQQAIRVKLSDLRDNTDPSRLSGRPGGVDKARMRKYRRALLRLCCVEECW